MRKRENILPRQPAVVLGPLPVPNYETSYKGPKRENVVERQSSVDGTEYVVDSTGMMPMRYTTTLPQTASGLTELSGSLGDIPLSKASTQCFYPHVVQARSKIIRGTALKAGHKHIRSAYAFIQRPEDGHILMVCEKPRLFHKGIDPYVRPVVWSLPGGKIDVNEHKKPALVREVKEETGLDICIQDEMFQATRENPHDGKGVRMDATVYACAFTGGTLLTDGAGDSAASGGDQQIEHAEFVSVEDALTLLKYNPDPTIHEGLISYLKNGQSIYKKWRYRHENPQNDARVQADPMVPRTVLRLEPQL